jgi:hypothetical protein
MSKKSTGKGRTAVLPTFQKTIFCLCQTDIGEKKPGTGQVLSGKNKALFWLLDFLIIEEAMLSLYPFIQDAG